MRGQKLKKTRTSLLKKSILLGLFSSIFANPLFAQDLILACSGLETWQFYHYSKEGKLSHSNEESKRVNYTLTIKNAMHETLPCKFGDEAIYCSGCVFSKDPINCKADPISYTSVDRYTGQVTVSRFMKVPEMTAIKKFEGTCSRVEKKKF